MRLFVTTLLVVLMLASSFGTGLHADVAGTSTEAHESASMHADAPPACCDVGLHDMSGGCYAVASLATVDVWPLQPESAGRMPAPGAQREIALAGPETPRKPPRTV